MRGSAYSIRGGKDNLGKNLRFFYTIPQNFRIQIFSWSRETKPEKDRDFDKNSEIIQNIVLLTIFVINFTNNEFPFFFDLHLNIPSFLREYVRKMSFARLRTAKLACVRKNTLFFMRKP